jgi:hypothetical protein
MGYGTNAGIGISFQTSYGTASGVSSLCYIPFVSENVGLDIPDLIPESKTGIFDEADSEGGPRAIAGDISFEPRPIELGIVLKAVCGDAFSSVNSGGIYTHSFRPRASDWDDSAANVPFTMYKDLATSDDALLHRDLVGTSLEFSIANGELLKGRLGVVGGTEGTTTTQTASYHGGRYFTWDVTSVSLGGSANADIEQLTITQEENLEPVHTLNNSKYPSSIKRGGTKRSVSISGTIKFNDNTEYDKFTAQSNEIGVITFTGPTEIQSGYYDSFIIRLPELKYTEFKPTAEGDGEVSVSFSAKGQYSTSEANSIRFTLTNTMAAY